MSSKITYPQYRKYSNGKSFFKIMSDSEFEEIQLLGNKKTIQTFKAKILPDRNYIYDLTFDYHKNWIAIDFLEYENVRKSID